ncbi:uncharacterized protein LOC112556985 [Pomacea canaliculata]|uniref:uncharacterized protein LOC112556985 n=1 Tax=Pomacea canaliculata TaxID=400727 RepID=UPI000D73C60F|nr:uncharacterized protein LOC112556985 [Pomacea canaliculata]
MKFISSLAVVLAIAMTTQGCPFFMSLDEANNCVFDPLRALSSNREDIEGLKREKREVDTDPQQGLRREKRQVGSNCPFCADGVVMLYPDWTDTTCSSFFFALGASTLDTAAMQQDLIFNPTTKACEPIINPSNVCFYRSFVS